MKRLLTISLLCGASVWASRSGDFREHTRSASSIVVGEVSASRSYYGNDGEIYTDVSVAVSSTLKESGRKAARVRTFTVKGGTVGGTTVVFTHMPTFEPSEAVVVFFEGDAPSDKFAIRGGWVPELGERATKVLDEIAQELEAINEPVPDAERQRARAFVTEMAATPAPADAACFALIGPKWDGAVATYKVGTTIPTTWKTALDSSIASWNKAGTPFNFKVDAASTNEFLVGPVTGASTLAVTRIEYDSTMRMRRFTMTFNNTVSWSPTGEAGKFDVEAVTAHELGHALGLDHAAGSACTEQTMWPSAASGETKKRTLENGDKAGAAKLYPAATATPAPAPVPAPAPTVTAAAPGFTSMALFPAPKAAQPFALWVVGTAFEGTVQVVVTGPSCPSTCVLNPTFKTTTLVSDVITLSTKGAHAVAVRNGATGKLSATKAVTVQ